MKKRRKKSVLKKMMDEAESLWKENCRLRDHDQCQRCGKSKSDGVVIQVDHFFSRTTSELFIDIRNGTTLCKGCHFEKTKKLHGVDKIVEMIVIAREGQEWFDKAEALYMNRKPFIWNFLKLEQKIISLKEERAGFLGGFSVCREEN